MTISRTAVTVAASLPAGVMLAVVAHGKLDPGTAAVALGFTTAAAATSSAAWHGVKAAVDRHEDTVRTRRHRRTPEPLPGRRPQTGAEPDAPQRRDVIDQPHRDVATPEDRQALAEALNAERAERPPYVDPYLTPAAVDADGYPAPDPGTRLDLDTDLSARAWTPAPS